MLHCFQVSRSALVIVMIWWFLSSAEGIWGGTGPQRWSYWHFILKVAEGDRKSWCSAGRIYITGQSTDAAGAPSATPAETGISWKLTSEFNY